MPQIGIHSIGLAAASLGEFQQHQRVENGDSVIDKLAAAGAFGNIIR